MSARRKKRQDISAATSKTDTEFTCWWCGMSLNQAHRKYDGLCMSCFMDFQEDDLQLAIFKDVI